MQQVQYDYHDHQMIIMVQYDHLILSATHLAHRLDQPHHLSSKMTSPRGLLSAPRLDLLRLAFLDSRRTRLDFSRHTSLLPEGGSQWLSWHTPPPPFSQPTNSNSTSLNYLPEIHLNLELRRMQKLFCPTFSAFNAYSSRNSFSFSHLTMQCFYDWKMTFCVRFKSKNYFCRIL